IGWQAFVFLGDPSRSAWRAIRPCGARVPLSVLCCGRVVNSERSLSAGQTANVLLKQHDPCIPHQSTACGERPDSPRRPARVPQENKKRLVAATLLLAI